MIIKTDDIQIEFNKINYQSDSSEGDDVENNNNNTQKEEELKGARAKTKNNSAKNNSSKNHTKSLILSDNNQENCDGDLADVDETLKTNVTPNRRKQRKRKIKQ